MHRLKILIKHTEITKPLIINRFSDSDSRAIRYNIQMDRHIAALLYDTEQAQPGAFSVCAIIKTGDLSRFHDGSLFLCNLCDMRVNAFIPVQEAFQINFVTDSESFNCLVYVSAAVTEI